MNAPRSILCHLVRARSGANACGNSRYDWSACGQSARGHDDGGRARLKHSRIVRGGSRKIDADRRRSKGREAV